jgi:putative MATE family efflux protein
VEAEVEELGDPESGPALPSTTLAFHAAAPAREVATPSHRPSSTAREILRLAWPIFLAQGVVAIAGLIDRAMVGRLGVDGGAAIPLAAVGFATQFFFVIQSTLFAVSLACVALVARAIGAGDPRRSQLALSASLQVSIAVSGGLSVAMILGARPALEFLGAEPVVIESGLPYLNLLLTSSVLLAVSLVIDSALRANKNMKTPMWVAVAATATKLGFNWLLIFGNWGLPRLELVGAGLATLLSQAVALALLVWALVREPKHSPLSITWRDFLRRSPLQREVIRIAVPGIAERIVMNLAMLAYFWILSRYYGTVAVAAYTVGVALLSFSWLPGLAYAQACATLVGQSLGAHDTEEATRTGWQAAAMSVVTAVALGFVVWFGADFLARMFTDDAEVIAELVPFMLVLAVTQPFLQLHFTLGGAHRGAGDTFTPLVAASVGNWVFRVPLACFFAMVLRTDIMWVWYALIFDHLARSIHLVWSFRRGRWKDALGATPSR